MMSAAEMASCAVLTLCAAIVGLTVLPRPKPAGDEIPAPVEIVEVAPPAAQAAPDGAKAETPPPAQTRIDALAKDVRQAKRDIDEIKDAIKLKQAIERLPDESGDAK